MLTTETHIIGGVTYHITDHSDGGLSSSDVAGILSNLNKTDAYNDRVTDDLKSSTNPSDKIVYIEIDDPIRDQTLAWYEGNGGVNLRSSDFIDGFTYEEKNTGESVQKDVDSALFHEMVHLRDERAGEDMSDLSSSINCASESESFSREEVKIRSGRS